MTQPSLPLTYPETPGFKVVGPSKQAAEQIATLENMLRREEQEHARCKHRLYLANERIAALLKKTGANKCPTTNQNK